MERVLKDNTPKKVNSTHSQKMGYKEQYYGLFMKAPHLSMKVMNFKSAISWERKGWPEKEHSKRKKFLHVGGVGLEPTTSSV